MSPDHMLARVEDLPEGTHKAVHADGREIGIFNVPSSHYAVPNNCPRQYGPLCQRAVSGTVEANAEAGWKAVWLRKGKIVARHGHTAQFEIMTGRCLAEVPAPSKVTNKITRISFIVSPSLGACRALGADWAINAGRFFIGGSRYKSRIGRSPACGSKADCHLARYFAPRLTL